MTRITGTLHEELCTFMTVSCSVLLRMRNVSDKSCRENQNTHFVFNNFFLPENRAVIAIMWKNVVERGRPQRAIWHMRNGCRIPKATSAYSEYVIPVALRCNNGYANASLCCLILYIACLVIYTIH